MNGKDGLPGVTYNNTLSIPESAKSCAEKNGLSFNLINDCVDSNHGAQLLHDSHFQTMDLFNEHGGYSPPGTKASERRDEM